MQFAPTAGTPAEEALRAEVRAFPTTELPAGHRPAPGPAARSGYGSGPCHT